MRPSGLAADAEDSRLPGEFVSGETPLVEDETLNAVEAQRDHLTNPDDIYVSEQTRHARWSSFEDHVRRNRADITSGCGSCGNERKKVA